MRSFCILFAVCLLLAVSASVVIAGGSIVIEGTGDSQLLLRTLGQAFERRHPGSEIIVPDSIGSSGGVKALIRGECNMARVARPLEERELTAASDLVYHEFVYSPVVVVANLPQSCVENLSSEQLVAIYSGSIKQWSELGPCPEQKIYVAMREEGDSSRIVIEKNLPGFNEIEQFAGQIVYSTPETLEVIKEHPYTIGFLPHGMVSDSLQIFSIDDADPSEGQLLDGRYPFAVPLGLVWRGQLNGLEKQFLVFIASAEGSEIIHRLKAVPVHKHSH